MVACAMFTQSVAVPDCNLCPVAITLWSRDMAFMDITMLNFFILLTCSIVYTNTSCFGWKSSSGPPACHSIREHVCNVVSIHC